MELPIFIFIAGCLATSALAEDYGLYFRATLGDSCDEPVVGVQFPDLFYRMTFDAELHIDGKPVVGKPLDGGGQTVIGSPQVTGSLVGPNEVDGIEIKGLKSGCNYATADLYRGEKKFFTFYRFGDGPSFTYRPAEWRLIFERYSSAGLSQTVWMDRIKKCPWLEVDLTEFYEHIHFEANTDNLRKHPKTEFYSERMDAHFLEQVPEGRKIRFTDANMEKTGFTVGGLNPDCYEMAHLHRKQPFHKLERVMTFVAKADNDELTKLKGRVANRDQIVYFRPADKWTLVFKGGARPAEETLMVVYRKMVVNCIAGDLGVVVYPEEEKTNVQLLRDEMEDGNPISLEGFEVTMVNGCDFKQLVIYRWPDVKTKDRRTEIATYDLPMADVARQSFGTNAAKTKSAQRSRSRRAKKGSRRAHKSKKGSR